MARAWHLMSRPQGRADQREFRLEAVDLPAPRTAWLRVANRWLSVDPYMRAG